MKFLKVRLKRGGWVYLKDYRTGVMGTQQCILGEEVDIEGVPCPDMVGRVSVIGMQSVQSVIPMRYCDQERCLVEMKEQGK
jgi:hypothetical protein